MNPTVYIQAFACLALSALSLYAAKSFWLPAAVAAGLFLAFSFWPRRS